MKITTVGIASKPKQLIEDQNIARVREGGEATRYFSIVGTVIRSLLLLLLIVVLI